jgi:HEAT repeat protein
MISRVVHYILVVFAFIAVTGCCDERALPSAIKALYSEKPSDQNKALLLLAKCKHKADSAVPRIAQLMYDDNVGVASSAAYALRCIDSKEARAALKRAEQARAARRAQR